MKKQLFNISYTMAAKVVAMVLFVISDIVAARFLDKDSYSTWVYFYSIETIFVYICNMGINSATKICITLEDDVKLSFAYCGFIIRIVVGILMAIGVFLIAPSICRIVNSRGKYIYLDNMIRYAGVLACADSFFEYFKEISYGLAEYKNVLLVNVAQYGAYLFCTSLFVIMVERDNGGMLMGYICSVVIGLFVCYLIFKSKIDDYKKCTFSWEKVKRILKKALPLYANDISNMLSMEFDTMMIGVMATPYQVAIYGIGKKMCSKVGQFNIAVAAGVMTPLAAMNTNNYDSKKKELNQAVLINIGVSLLAVMGLLFYAIFFIPFAYGKNYLGAQAIVYFMIIYYAFFSFSSFFALFLDFQNKSLYRSIFGVISVLINIGLNYMLIPYYGAIGAVIATVVSQILYAMAVMLTYRLFISRIGSKVNEK